MGSVTPCLCVEMAATLGSYSWNAEIASVTKSWVRFGGPTSRLRYGRPHVFYRLALSRHFAI